MPQAPADRHHVESSSNEGGLVGVPQRVERYARQLQGHAGILPAPGQTVRRDGRAIGLTENQRVVIGLPEPQGQARFKELAPVFSQGCDHARGDADGAPPMGRLRGFEAQPGFGLLQRALYAHGGAIQVNVGKPKGEEFAAAHPGAQVGDSDRLEPVPIEFLQHVGNLLGVQDLDLVGLDRGRRYDGCHIARQHLAPDGALQGAVQNTMGVAGGPR